MNSNDTVEPVYKRRYISLIILVMVVLGTAVSANFYIPGPIVDYLVENQVKNQSPVWQRRIMNLINNRDNLFAGEQLDNDDISNLNQFTHASDVYHLKIFDATGQVFWSSRIAEIGSIQNNADVFAELALGRSFYKTDLKPVSEIENFSVIGTNGIVDDNEMRKIAEIYEPIIYEGKLEGAIEFYRDVTETEASYRDLVSLALLVFTIVSSTLFLTTAGAVIISDERRLRQLQIWSNHENELKEKQIALNQEVRLLSELSEWLQSSRTLDELFGMVERFMTQLLPNCAGSVYVYSNSRDVLDGSCSWNGDHCHNHIKPESCWSLRRGRTYAYGENEIDFVCDHLDDHNEDAYLCLPILAHGETVGLMHVKPMESNDKETFFKCRKLAQMAAEQISLAIANAKMRDQLHDQSIRDALTNLYNRRHMIEVLRKQVDVARISNNPLSLVSIDVDHFKKFNDNFGHDAGDMVLRAVGATLEQECDGDELPCRMGGEEFMVLLPSISVEGAVERAEKIRKAVEAIVVRYGDKSLPHITISLGVASYPEHGMIPQDLIKYADEALYDAKAHGRNQISLGKGKSKELSALFQAGEKMRLAVRKDKTPMDQKNRAKERKAA